MDIQRQRSLAVQLLVTTPIRVLLNTAFRMAYPFLPEFSRGLGVSQAALTVLLSVRSGFGLTSPLFGLVPDRFGRRFSILLGLVIFCAGTAAVAPWPSFITFGLAIFAIVIAKFLHDPALLAHLGDQTPYARRGLVIGLSEFGWSGATFIGIPLLGLLIARFGWAAPFWPLAALGVLAMIGIAWVIAPGGSAAHTRSASRAARPLPWSLWLHPNVLATLSIGSVSALANEMLNVVYGRWMEQTFQLNVAALGLTVTVIGVAELMGEGAVAALSDRLGKRRMVLLATAVSVAAYLALPSLSGNLFLALGGIFLVYLGFETVIVSSIPLLTELVPEARGTVLSTAVALQSVGRMTGALLGAALFEAGFVWVGVAAAVINALVMVVVWRVVRERAW